jgi:hypothetical protein
MQEIDQDEELKAMLPPKPENTVFGIRADGQDMPIGFPTVTEAEAAARGLFEKGYQRVEIIDCVSCRVVKRLTR